MTQRDLGTVLYALAVAFPNYDLLPDAVKAYKNALQEWTRDRVPLYWAQTQYDLGIALWSFMSMDVVNHDPSHVEAASVAFSSASKEWLLEETSLDHIRAQEGFGATLAAAAFIKQDGGGLQTAKIALREAYWQVQLMGLSEHEDRFKKRLRSGAQMLHITLATQAARTLQ